MKPNENKKQALKRLLQGTSMLAVGTAFMISAGHAEAAKTVVPQSEQTIQSRIATLRDKLNQQDDKMQRANPQEPSDAKVVLSQWNNWKNY